MRGRVIPTRIGVNNGASDNTSDDTSNDASDNASDNASRNMSAKNLAPMALASGSGVRCAAFLAVDAGACHSHSHRRQQ